MDGGDGLHLCFLAWMRIDVCGENPRKNEYQGRLPSSL